MHASRSWGVMPTSRGAVGGLSLIVGLRVWPGGPAGLGVSVTDAAAALGISRTAIQNRINSGTLSAQQAGREWAIPLSALGT